MKATEPDGVLALLVFEAADCLMALPASEVARLLPQSGGALTGDADDTGTERIDLDEYFTGRPSDGPWLHWGRRERSAWLRIRGVVDVMSCAIGALTPMPSLLRAKRRTGAFLASGVRGGDVFLLLDPARLDTAEKGSGGKGIGSLFPSNRAKKAPDPFSPFSTS